MLVAKYNQIRDGHHALQVITFSGIVALGLGSEQCWLLSSIDREAVLAAKCVGCEVVFGTNFLVLTCMPKS